MLMHMEIGPLYVRREKMAAKGEASGLNKPINEVRGVFWHPRTVLAHNTTGPLLTLSFHSAQAYIYWQLHR